MTLMVAVILFFQDQGAGEIFKKIEQEKKDDSSGGPARDLFEKMAAKFSTAKTIQFSAKMTAEEDGKGAAELETTTLIAPSGRWRNDIEGRMKEKPFEFRVVCDGKKMWAKATGMGDPVILDVDEDDRKKLMISLTRDGVYWQSFGMVPIPKEKDEVPDFSYDDPSLLSDFKSGESRKIGERDAQSITYKVREYGIKEPFQVTLWLDREKMLPLERQVKLTLRGRSSKIHETYQGMKLDEPIDEMKFKLPAKK